MSSALGEVQKEIGLAKWRQVMIPFDPGENSRRIRDGILGLISGQIVQFSKDLSSLVVVFDDPVNRLSEGRILLFQQFVFDRFGIAPIIIKQVPACIKVYFDMNFESRNDAETFAEILSSGEFGQLAKNLKILQVQFLGKMYYYD